MADEVKQEYECSRCGNRLTAVLSDAPAPECCGRHMAATHSGPVCLSSDTPEHARADDDDEPCDDGRSG